MRKSYGNTWWGEQWLHALQGIDYSNRLPRGKSYANNGAARDIQIHENRITAKVQGSRPRPYKVEIAIPAFSAQQKAGILGIVTGNPVFLSRLLNRELPNELYQACLNQGIHIFPRSWRDMEGSCSCPDWAVPCKHMAAVLYLVANEIDKNPFLVFELHDFDLFKGLEGVGYTAAGQKEVRVLSVEDLWQTAEEEPIPFEWNAELFSELDFSTIPYCLDQLMGLLPPKANFFPDGDFRLELKKVYTSVARATESRPDGEWSPELERVEKVEILLDEELEFRHCRCFDARSKKSAQFDNLGELAAWLKQAPVSRLEQLSEPMRGLVLGFRLAEKLAEKSAFVPQFLELEEGRYKIRWLPAYLKQEVWEVADLVEMLTPPQLLYYLVGGEKGEPTEEDAFPALVGLFLNYFVQSGHGLDKTGRFNAIMRLFFYGSPERFESFETREYPSAIQLWLNRFFISDKKFVPVIQVEDLDRAFRVTISVEDKSRYLEAPTPLAEIFRDDSYREMRLDVLRDLTMLSDFFPQISRLVASKGKEELLFNPKEFVDILFKILPTIQLFGIKVLLPKALRKLLRPQLSLQLEGADKGTVKGTSLISLENMLRFQWQIALGDQVMTPEEFLKQVGRLSGIVKLNDQYVFFDEKEIQALIHKLERPPALGGHQLLQAALAEEYQGAKIKLDTRAQKLLADLLKGEKTKLPAGLEATLRPYQLRGYEWLYKNSRLGFGSLIADDMGLGKTVQVITALLKLKEDGEFKKQKGLVIVPTTLLTNWDKEIRRFAPGLKTHIYHGPGRKLEPLKDAELLLTTYGVVRSEAAKLQKHKWLTVVIDEAQNIKNPATAQTKAVKAIAAPVRIAMSGTPVENRLSEYWSIFDFTNKGYLGNLNQFKEDFARPIEIDRDQRQLNRFRKVTEPFILRRVKTDKAIISDLPDKVEQDQYCQLTTEQAAIYQNVLDNTLAAVEGAEGIERRGLVLKLITALKQVCNHPKHFLKTGASDPALSGKAMLLLDLLRQVLDGEEKAILFTQYQEMGKLLVDMLEKEFGFEAPFLHGGVSRKLRDEMVDDFQRNRSTRILLLSLKAGGTGLNLTAASNVIHYDLWWNPAVEAQATDRAYRIGQHRNVLVHRFITQGTFEEKINKLLQNKKELANLTVASGEKWIGELSNKELKELVQLG
ncbi:MAG: DEAD/DEAH box helicase [Saprospirales bacterium]|nr:DEAD/DEAH box helicase [Saprospirales bacterium]